MRIDTRKLDLILARRCINLRDLRGDGLAPNTLTRIKRGEDVLPATLGRIAKALGVDPTEIMEKED